MIDKLCTKMADALGSNAAVILFILIATVPLFYQVPRDVIGWQVWLSNTAIQLIALAVLAKVSKVESGRTTEILISINRSQSEDLKELKALHRELHQKLGVEKGE